MDEEKIVKMYEGGAPICRIALDEGCSDNAIKRRLQKNGVKIRGKGDGYKFESNFEGVVAMYKEGHTLEEVGEAFGMTAHAVARRVEAAGVKRGRQQRDIWQKKH